MVGILAVLRLSSALAFHPLHTSFAQVTFDARAKTVEVSIRVFADDFTSAAQAWAQPKRIKSEANAAYAIAAFTLRESGGKAIAFQSCGEKRVGDLMWICLRGQMSARPATVVSRIMFERFDDQVNIVQTNYAGHKANLLFTSDDKEKKI